MIRLSPCICILRMRDSCFFYIVMNVTDYDEFEPLNESFA